MPKTEKYINDSDDEDFKPGKEPVDNEEFEEQEESKPVKRKRQESNNHETDKDGNRIFQLSAKRRVTIRAFSNGEGSVDIREFYMDKNTQEMKPGKGICLPLAQWNKLKELVGDIDDALDALSPTKKQK